MPDVITTVSAVRKPRRRLLGVVGAAVSALLAVAGVVAITAPAQADPGLTGVVDGTVLLPDEATLVGLDDATVTAWQYDISSGDAQAIEVQSTQTDASGHWQFDSLASGRWAFEIEPNLADATIVGGFTAGEVNPYEVVADDAFESIGDDEARTLDPFALTAGATVSGHITGTAGADLPNGEASLYRLTYDEFGDFAMNYFGQAVTDDDGDYSFIGLPYGQYTVKFEAPTYITEFWDNEYVTGPDEADWFGLSAGESQTADAQLSVGGKVTGVVKGVGNAPLIDVDVSAYVDDEFAGWVSVGDAATTDTDGKYTLNGLTPGTEYRIGFDPSNNPAVPAYLPIYWNNAKTIEAATSFIASATVPKTANALLTKSSVITGTISLIDNPTPPLESELDIEVCPALDGCFFGPGPDYTADYNETTGVYRADGLPAGSYNLYVSYVGDGNYRDEFYDNQHSQALATKIVVGAAATTANKNVTLDLGAQISGTITSGGLGVAGISVGAYSYSQGFAEGPIRSAVTDGDGSYSIGGLGDGTYLVETLDESGNYAPRWYGNTYQQAKATKVDATVPNNRTGTDIELEYGATLYGDVIGNDGSGGIADANITVFRFDDLTGSFSEYGGDNVTSTDEFGHYQVYNLPPGQYAVQAESFFDYIAAFWNTSPDVKSANQASRISLSAGGDAEASFGLDLGGIYSGRVVDSHGDGIADVEVSVTDSFDDSYYTDSDGVFELGGLRPGPHVLRLNAEGAPGFTRETLIAEPATTVNVAAVELGDIAIEDESTITGFTRTTTGAALANVRVDAYTVGAGGELVYADETLSAPNGSFELNGLPTDTLYLEFNAPGATYGTQYLGGSPIWSLSTPVVFAAPGSATVDARLVTGGSVTGVVKNKVTGRVIPGIDVGVSQTFPGTDQVRNYDSGTTNSKGTYIVPGLNAGGYDVTFNGYATGPSLPYGASTSTTTVPDKGIATVNASLIPTSKVSGVIRRAGTLTPVVNGLVVAESADGATLQEYTDTTGAYSIQLPNGVWTLHFSDPRHLGAAAYFRTGSASGADNVTDATKITVTGNGAAFAARNVTLQATTASLTAHIMSAYESDPSGQFVLERVTPDGATVLSSELFYAEYYGNPLDSLFPITNVVPGTYRLVIDAQSGLGDGGMYPQFTTPTFLVGPAGVTDAGPFDVGTPELIHYENPTLVPGSEPVVTGDNTIGGAGLDVSEGTWSQSTKYHFFQWTRNGKPIPGANASNYVPTPGDAGKTVAVRVGASDFNDYYEPPYAYTAVAPGGVIPLAAPPVALDLPTITGKAFVGQVLTASTGHWDVPGVTYSYQWFRTVDVTTTPIAGATAATYKPVVADVSDLTSINVVVTTHRTGFEPGSASPGTGLMIQPAIALKATKAPVVSSTATDWKVTSGTWTPTGATITYEWQEYDPATGDKSPFGAGNTIPKSAAPLGAATRITVIVTASKPGYTTTRLELPVRTGAKPVFTTDPTVDLSAPQVGVPLVVAGGVAAPPVGTTPGLSIASYQWYRGTAVIAGATKATYTPTTLDVNKVLKVRVSLKATGYAAQVAADAREFVAGAAVAAPQPLAFNDDATLSGTPAVGRVVKVSSTGTWSSVPTSFTYQWDRNTGSGFVAIPKATAASYTLTAADLGASIQVHIFAHLGAQVGFGLLSFPDPIVTQPVTNVTPPAIPISARVGVKLTASGVGTWDVTPTAYTYQWYVNNTAITGAKSSSYTPIVDDLGEEISVRVTAKRTGFSDSTATSSNTATVLEGAAVAATKATSTKVGTKVVTTVKLGQTVLATPATWPNVGSTITQGWQVSVDGGTTWQALAQSGTSLLVATPLTTGDKVRFAVTATRAGYAPTTSASPALTIVP